MALQIVAVAVGWQIYDLTRSALMLGFIGLAQFAPMVLLVFVIGHVIDRYDRRTIARSCQTLMAAAAAALALLTATGTVTPLWIFVAVILFATGRAFEGPTMQAIMPGLIPEALIAPASARWAAANQTAVVVGPAVGGLLYAVSPAIVYALCAALSLTSVAIIGFVRYERATARREPPGLASIFGGIRFIRGDRIVFGAISLDLFAVLLGGATALLPIFARDVLGTGPWGLGLLRTAPAVGALTTSFVLARIGLRRHAGTTMFAAVALFGAATIAFGLSRSLWLSFVALVVLGAADIVSVVTRSTLVALRTPDEMRGRVNAVNSLFIGTSNQLGEFESGVTAAWLGAVPAVVIGGIGSLLVALVCRRVFPQLAAVDSLSERG